MVVGGRGTLQASLGCSTEVLAVASGQKPGFLSRHLLREEREAEALRQSARSRRRYVSGRDQPCSACGAASCNMVLEALEDEFGDRERRCRLCSGVDYLRKEK